jgi:hypothetical protein
MHRDRERVKNWRSVHYIEASVGGLAQSAMDTGSITGQGTACFYYLYRQKCVLVL